MSNFPPGWFFIQSRCPHKMVLDVAMDSLKVLIRNYAFLKRTHSGGPFATHSLTCRIRLRFPVSSQDCCVP